MKLTSRNVAIAAALWSIFFILALTRTPGWLAALLYAYWFHRQLHREEEANTAEAPYDVNDIIKRAEEQKGYAQKRLASVAMPVAILVIAFALELWLKKETGDIAFPQLWASPVMLIPLWGLAMAACYGEWRRLKRG